MLKNICVKRHIDIHGHPDSSDPQASNARRPGMQITGVFRLDTLNEILSCLEYTKHVFLA